MDMEYATVPPFPCPPPVLTFTRWVTCAEIGAHSTTANSGAALRNFEVPMSDLLAQLAATGFEPAHPERSIRPKFRAAPRVTRRRETGSRWPRGNSPFLSPGASA